ncbi:adenylate kinase 7-like isoform X1 [Alosa sapidissima]|uniref:adenylate kinase 7-like isoform X1 n=1 Tax=Alosa sapidissima TaxID=34773 RepID=UPI001C089881|nr:adenylate kinase 7-like isoform X1 [Alosa sapidissima]
MADNKGAVATRTKRIFVNNVDSYSSKNIAKILSACVPGESLGENEEEEEASSLANGKISTSQRTFQIVGTVANTGGEKQSFTVEEYSSDNRDELYQRLLDCDVIVYNITEDANELDEATWAITTLHTYIEHLGVPKTFILVTPLMAWALTKSSDPDDPDVALTEDDFRRRRPHPNYKEFSVVEKNVLKLGRTKKSRLSTYVVTSALQYGMGEGIFHPFFKMAWLGQVEKIPIYGAGTNVVPTIHVSDLAGVIQNIIDHKPKEHFFFAVDDSNNTLEEIIRAISLSLGTGETELLSKEAALQAKVLTLAELDYLTVNLRVDGFSVKNTLNVQWVCETGFVENLGRVIAEYKHTRKLLPIKMCLLGPPAVGKSSVAEKLSKVYQIHHINVKAIFDEKIKSLYPVDENDTNTTKPPELDEQTRHSLVRERLNSMPCRNHGFVLDGFPNTYSEAKDFFYSDDFSMGLEAHGPGLNSIDANIMPDYIFSLDATDEFLKERVLNLPERAAVKMGYTQDKFLASLMAFREANVEDQTVLNYFDEQEIHPESIEINDSNDRDNLAAVERITTIIGAPNNYRLTPEEQKAAELKADLLRQEKLQQEATEKERMEAEQAARLAIELEKWKRHVAEVKKQETELLEAHSFPLRNYLMKYVMPTVSQGLLESCKAKADDPVDFLAEYLLRNSLEDD